MAELKCEICKKLVDESEIRRWTQRHPRRVFQVCPRCHANLEPDAPENANTPCYQCGRKPAAYIKLVAGIGRLLYRKEETYDGWFCKKCGLSLYDHVMKRHLANTWWSPTSLLFGATIGTGVNLLAKHKLTSLGEPS